MLTALHAAPLLIALVHAGSAPFAGAPTIVGAGLQEPPTVLELYERVAPAVPWPEFEPLAVPRAVWDGERTWLTAHPGPPEGFEPVEGRAGLFVLEGRHPAMRANTSAEIGGVTTATLLADGRDGEELAGVLVHEAFHVYQRREHPHWSGNVVALLVLPQEDVDVLTLRMLETRSLRRALGASVDDDAAAWAWAALVLREERFELLPEDAVAWERGSELNEGLAQYVQDRCVPPARPRELPLDGFGADEARARSYATGQALALLLDRFDENWKQQLVHDTGARFEWMLRRALLKRGAEPRAIPPEERAEVRALAREAVSELRERNAAAREEFESAEGFRVVLEAAGDATLAVQNFDPMNLRRLAPGEVLHLRWLKLAGGGAEIEVLDAVALTESAGEHPLFSGVRRLTLAGLTEPPRVAKAPDGLLLQGPGLQARLPGTGARLEWGDEQLVVRLGADD